MGAPPPVPPADRVFPYGERGKLITLPSDMKIVSCTTWCRPGTTSRYIRIDGEVPSSEPFIMQTSRPSRLARVAYLALAGLVCAALTAGYLSACFSQGHPMTRNDQARLNALLEIADEDPCPLTAWEVEFVRSLDGQRERDLSAKQADRFDQLVRRHLRGED